MLKMSVDGEEWETLAAIPPPVNITQQAVWVIMYCFFTVLLNSLCKSLATILLIERRFLCYSYALI